MEISANIEDLPDDMRQKLIRAALGEYEQREVARGLRSVLVPGMGTVYHVDSEEGREALEHMMAVQADILRDFFDG